MPALTLTCTWLMPGKLYSTGSSTVMMLICFLPDRKDGKQHFQHGMIQEFEVGGAIATR